MIGKSAMRSIYRQLRSVDALAMPLAMVDQLLRPQGFLRDSGWLESYRRKVPTSGNGPLPWFTYAAISFLEPRLKPSFSVFEYGAGFSTLWWASRVAAVNSCENDQAWLTRLEQQRPQNAQLFYEERGPAYWQKAAAFSSDIIVIDGRDRVECARACLPGLRPTGVIVWDNSDRARYEPGYDRLKQEGFRRLDFSGPGPVNFTPWMTSVFYRDQNCLGI
jgi:hypothetical protein